MAPSEQEVDAPVMEQQGPEDAEDDLLWAQAFQQELDESLRMELENTLGDQEDAPAVVEAERYQEEEENLLHTPEELWLPGGLRVEEWLADPTPAAVLPRDEASEMGLRLLRARGTVWFTVGGTMHPRVQAIAKDLRAMVPHHELLVDDPFSDMPVVTSPTYTELEQSLMGGQVWEGDVTSDDWVSMLMAKKGAVREGVGALLSARGVQPGSVPRTTQLHCNWLHVMWHVWLDFSHMGRPSKRSAEGGGDNAAKQQRMGAPPQHSEDPIRGSVLLQAPSCREWHHLQACLAGHPRGGERLNVWMDRVSGAISALMETAPVSWEALVGNLMDCAHGNGEQLNLYLAPRLPGEALRAAALAVQQAKLGVPPWDEGAIATLEQLDNLLPQQPWALHTHTSCGERLEQAITTLVRSEHYGLAPLAALLRYLKSDVAAQRGFWIPLVMSAADQAGAREVEQSTITIRVMNTFINNT